MPIYSFHKPWGSDSVGSTKTQASQALCCEKYADLAAAEIVPSTELGESVDLWQR